MEHMVGNIQVQGDMVYIVFDQDDWGGFTLPKKHVIRFAEMLENMQNGSIDDIHFEFDSRSVIRKVYINEKEFPNSPINWHYKEKEIKEIIIKHTDNKLGVDYFYAYDYVIEQTIKNLRNVAKDKHIFDTLKEYFDYWVEKYETKFPYNERKLMYEVQDMIELTEEWEERE